MKKPTIRRSLLILVAMVAVLLPTAALVSSAGATETEAPTYRITFENNTTGQYFTPPNVAIHNNAVSVFDLRQPASPGVQAVAENGSVPVLAAELAGAVDDAGLGVSGVIGGAPIPPGASVEGEFSSNEAKFSLVSMIICTNDGFAGSRAKNLPQADGESITYDLRGYDAGTEVNTERVADIVPAPFCGDGSGTDQTNPSLAEDGVVRVHRTLQGNGDIDASKDWDNNEDIARVTITRVAADDGSGPAPTPTDDVATYAVRFVNNSTGQYFTPPNVAIHNNAVSVFDLRQPASPGVQAVAENGSVPVLAAELAGAVDDAGLGVSGVIGGAPIPPGASVEGEFSSNEAKFSLVSMIICTNDGFAGSRAKNLPQADGESITYDLRGYDAGTEVNTERVADIVPAPFCGDGSGTDQTNPSLAEDGVVRVHRTLQGNGDIDASKDWDNNEDIAYVEITRID